MLPTTTTDTTATRAVLTMAPPAHLVAATGSPTATPGPVIPLEAEPSTSKPRSATSLHRSPLILQIMQFQLLQMM